MTSAALRLLSTAPGIGGRYLESRRLVDGGNPVDRNEMMLTVSSRIISFQFNRVTLDVIDHSDVLSIGAQHLHVFRKPRRQARRETSGVLCIGH